MAEVTPSGVREMRVQEALREALRYEMARDGRVFVMGEDVALFGGAYGVTRGLLQEFGEQRSRHFSGRQTTVVLAHRTMLTGQYARAFRDRQGQTAPRHCRRRA